MAQKNADCGPSQLTWSKDQGWWCCFTCTKWSSEL